MCGPDIPAFQAVQGVLRGVKLGSAAQSSIPRQ